MKKYIVLALSLFSFLTFSSENMFQNLLIEENEKTNYVLNDQVDQGYDWALKTIRVRIRLTTGINFPGLASAKIRPEVELFYTK